MNESFIKVDLIPTDALRINGFFENFGKAWKTDSEKDLGAVGLEPTES